MTDRIIRAPSSVAPCGLTMPRGDDPLRAQWADVARLFEQLRAERSRQAAMPLRHARAQALMALAAARLAVAQTRKGKRP